MGRERGGHLAEEIRVDVGGQGDFGVVQAEALAGQAGFAAELEAGQVEFVGTAVGGILAHQSEADGRVECVAGVRLRQSGLIGGAGEQHRRNDDSLHDEFSR